MPLKVVIEIGENRSFPFIRIPESKFISGSLLRLLQGCLEAVTRITYKTEDDSNHEFMNGKKTIIKHSGNQPGNQLEPLRDYLIQILEEKFGLVVKICGNCKHYSRGHGHCCTEESFKWVAAGSPPIRNCWIPINPNPEK